MYLGSDRAMNSALENGFEWDFVSVANNEFLSMGQYGLGDLQRQRWQIYQKNFCDFAAENGDAGCGTPGAPGSPNTGPLLPNADMDVLPGRMLFAP